jgi:high affinity cAMP-specific and IBMX-insensitive 3',5'-cyclic phosphodiesterase 8
VTFIRSSVFEKDDTAILSLLDVGYNRVSLKPGASAVALTSLHPAFQCIIESPHVSMCSSELRQIQHSLIRPQNVIASQQALYAALHRVRDTIIITDDALRIQYTNKTTERILGLKVVSLRGGKGGKEISLTSILAGRNRWPSAPRPPQFRRFSPSKPNQ